TIVRTDLIRMHMARGDAADSTEDYLKEAGAAIDIYKKVEAVRVTEAKGNPQATGDALSAERSWPAAIIAYQHCGTPDEAPIECANRLVLAQINAGKLREAAITAHTIVRAKRNDATTD